MAAQMRRITGKRDSGMDTAMGRLLPHPALLKKRLAMTGKTWTVGQYGMATVGLLVAGRRPAGARAARRCCCRC